MTASEKPSRNGHDSEPEAEQTALEREFFADGDDYTPRTSSVSLEDRPPMVTLRG